MTIAQRLLLAISFFLILLIASGMIALNQLDRVAEKGELLANVELPSVRYSGAIRAEVIDFRNRDTQLLIVKSPDEIDETLGRQKKNSENLASFIAKFEAIAQRPEQKEMIEQFRAGWAAYMKTHDELVRLARAEEKQAALDYFRGEQRKSFRSVLPLIDKIVENSTASSDALRAEAATAQRTGRLQMIIAVALSLFVGIGIGIVLYRSVTRPLMRMRSSVRRIVETRDFTASTGVTGRDEIADTARTVDELIAAMRGTLREFLDASDQLANVAGQLSAAARQVEGSSMEQSETAASMAASVEQMTVSIGQVSDNAQALSGATHDSDRSADQGRLIMAEASAQVEQVGKHIRESAAAIEALGQSSKEITSIVHTIRDVADQTNLLALNAAIEAARAGEQGRGFAVVADEVRKLAERTALATQDISEKILAIQQGTEAAGERMRVSVAEVSQSVHSAESANAAVAHIKESVARVDGEIDAMSSALREQATTSTEIARRVEKVAQLSEENSRSAGEAARLSSTLNDLAIALRTRTASFTI